MESKVTKVRFSSQLDLVTSPQELCQLLGSKDPMLLSARTLASVVRAVKRVAFAAQFRVALCGTHTFEPLDAYLRAHRAFIGMGIDTYVAPYGQYMLHLSGTPPALAAYLRSSRSDPGRHESRNYRQAISSPRLVCHARVLLALSCPGLPKSRGRTIA